MQTNMIPQKSMTTRSMSRAQNSSTASTSDVNSPAPKLSQPLFLSILDSPLNTGNSDTPYSDSLPDLSITPTRKMRLEAQLCENISKSPSINK